MSRNEGKRTVGKIGKTIKSSSEKWRIVGKLKYLGCHDFKPYIAHHSPDLEGTAGTV